MTRLIDADKLASDLLERWHTADKEAETMISAVMADVVTPILTSQPTVNTEQQWVPVEKEMPPIGMAVLVYAISDDGDHYFMTTASHEGGKYWYDECFYQRMPKVYAWMKLPKPYNEVKL